MKRMREGSKADQREDKRVGEGTARDTERVKKRKTVASKSKRPRVGGY